MLSPMSDTGMDEIFDKWTALSDEYHRQFLLLQAGDESVRPMVRQLAKELEVLTRAMREAERRAGERMKPGIYEIKFTMDGRSLGTGVVIIKGRSFVGADGVQFYRGDIQREAAVVSVLMEVTRHNFAVHSPFGSQALFTLKWRGFVAEDFGFQLQHRPTGSSSTIYVAGKLLQES
jgi:hypothetical protein